MVKGDYQDRARGMLVGLAVGDALGAPIEFGYYSFDILPNTLITNTILYSRDCSKIHLSQT